MAWTLFFESQPWAFPITIAILGLIVGSFLNVVIYRVPVMMEREWHSQCCELFEKEEPEQEPFNLVFPHSRCPKCNHAIRAWENIPVVSYLALGGKCSSCKTKISPRYPIIELVTGLLSCHLAWQFGFSWQTGAALLLLWTLVALTMIDFDTQLLPDQFTLPLVWLGLIVNSQGLFVSLESALWGAIAGYMILWTLFWVFKLLTGKEGMGYGDFKLLAALGAWMGWQALPLIILLSSVTGAVIGVSMIVFRNHEREVPIPFGPYLAIAGWLNFHWGSDIMNWYVGILP